MDNREAIGKSIQDEHLDMLIRLAYRREDERLCRQYGYEESMDAIPAEQRAAIYAKVLEKYEAIEREKARAARIRKWKNHVPRIINAAACIALILCIAAPIAVAKVEFIRVRVMKLLAEIQEDHTRLSLIEDEEAAFYIPADWRGKYYPSYLPEGFELSWYSPISVEAIWRNGQGDYLHYIESKESMAIGIDSEKAVQSDVLIGATKALLFEGEDKLALAWSDGETFFSISTNLPKEEGMQIASNVRKIIN